MKYRLAYIFITTAMIVSTLLPLQMITKATSTTTTPPPPPPTTTSPNLIPNPSAESVTNGTPTGWLRGRWGTNAPVYSLRNPGQDGNVSMAVNITTRTSGGAEWYFNYISVRPSSEYTFSNFYKSDVPSNVSVEINTTSGAWQYINLGDLAPSPDGFTQFTARFTTPSNVRRLTVLHNITSVGTIETDNFSLTGPPPISNPTSPSPTLNRPLISVEFDDGALGAYELGLPIVESFGLKTTQYIFTGSIGRPAQMQDSHILDMHARGHDIGNHTISHPYLTQLSQSAIHTEVSQSKNYLQNLLGTQVNLFATPYCAFNSTVRSIVAQYHPSMRNCVAEINSKSNFDPYNIRAMTVSKPTVANVQTWIEQARSRRGWLVIVYHHVSENGGEWSVTPNELRAQLQAIRDSGITVLKTSEALAEVRSQL